MRSGLIELGILVFAFVVVVVVVIRFICADLPPDFVSKITHRDKGGQ